VASGFAARDWLVQARLITVAWRNLSAVRIGIVLLRPGSTKLPDLVEHAPDITEALRVVKPGERFAVRRP
jgi:hypothetical protein